MKSFKKVLALASLVCAVSALRADQGTTSASFLKLAVGPRAIGMGEAFAGVADDVNALYYNPAGLAYVPDKEFTLMHSVWFQDIFFDNAAVAWPIKDFGT